MFNDRTPAMSPEMPSPTASAPASVPLPPTLPLRADTRAWRVQVWLAFGLAAALCAIGLAWLPGEDLDRAFMFMGYGFCLSSAFAVAKHVRDGQARLATTPMWGAVVWGGFGLAMALTAWGLVRMDIHPTYKAGQDAARRPRAGDGAGGGRGAVAPRRRGNGRMNGPMNRPIVPSLFTERPLMSTFFCRDLLPLAWPRRATAVLAAAALAVASASAPLMSSAQAHRAPLGSELSALSLLPVAVSVVAPVAVLASGAALTVVAVESASGATVWVLERASDGARASITLSGTAVAGASVAVGTVVAVTVLSTGWVLSAAGQAIAYVPNEIGRALLYNERLTGTR
jgi:hypothetical protein